MSERAGPTSLGGPPRFFALLAQGDHVLAGTCGRGISRSVDSGRTWQPHPGLPSVNALIPGPAAELLAATADGLRRSIDGGISWRSMGPDGVTVYCVVATRQRLVIGTLDRGLLFSGDGGATWCEGPMPGATVYRLLPLPDGDVLAATDGRGVWRVRLGQDEVEAVPSGLDGLGVFALAVAGSRVLAGTREAGVHCSDDAGTTWRPSRDGLADTMVHALAVDDAGVAHAATGRGVERSTDRGDTWAPMGCELAHHRVFSLACARRGVVFCGSYDGVWMWSPSGDSAECWTAVDTGLSAGDAYSVSIEAAGVAFAGTASGALRSHDGGRTWRPAGDGIDGRHVYAMAELASGERLAGTDHGLFRNRGGSAWEPAGLDGQRVFRLLETDAGAVLAGTLGAGVWRRDPDDAGWHASTNGLPHEQAFEVMQTRAGDVLVGTGTIVGGTKIGGIFRSQDLGATWRLTESDALAVYRIVESSTGVLFGGGQRCRILRSHDGGATWTSLDTTGTTDTKMFCLAIDADDRLYLGAGAQLLISDDGADSWEAAGDGLDGATVYDLAVHPSGSLIAATSYGLYRSLDRGETWEPGRA